jgi:hypothetical protein
MFRGDDLAPAGSLSLADDAENVRDNARDGTVLVGYGKSGLAVIDPERRSKIADIKLAAHPEGFQISPDTGIVFVNLPDTRQIAVVDLNNRRIAAVWKQTDADANFPIALD